MPRPLAPLATALLLAGLLGGTPVPLRADGEGEAAPAGVRALRPWLRHEDRILRALAAFELRRHVARGTIELATEALERERDFLVLGCALGSLEGRARPDLVVEGGARLPGVLLRLLDHPHPVVRDRAWAVLRRIPDEEVGDDAAAMRRWWLAARRDLLDEQARIREAEAAPAGDAPAPVAGESRTDPAAPAPGVYDHVERLRLDGLELVIVLDDTGSMGMVIGQAAARARSLVRRLGWLVPRFRAGLVTYKDGARLRLALTVDGEALEKALRKVSANGGGDWEEGVDQGIAVAFRQETVAWSRNAHRVMVVIGDAPPHEGDVAGLLRLIRRRRDEDLDLFRHPVVVHTVSTSPGGVEHFPQIAAVGGGVHVTLGQVGRLEEALVGLAFGAAFADRVRPWLEEVEHLRRHAPDE